MPSLLSVIVDKAKSLIHFRGNLQVKRLFQKLWPLMYRRAELDLRSTKEVLLRETDIKINREQPQ